MAWDSFITGDKTAESEAAYNDYTKQMGAATGNYTGTVNKALDPYGKLVEGGNFEQRYHDYLGALEGLDPSQYKVQGAQTQAINPLDQVGNYIDPNVKFQQDAARRGIEESAAGRGGLFSGAAGSKIATSQEELAAKAWQDSMDRAQDVQESENQRRLQQQQAEQNAGTYNLGLDETGVKAKGTAYDVSMNPLETVTQGKISMAGTQYGADTGMAGTAYQYGMEKAKQPSGWETFMDGISKGAGAATGVAKAGSSMNLF